MVELSPDQNLQFGHFVVRFGGVSEVQLQEAIAQWRQEPTRSLGELLVAAGALTEQARRSLETLFAAQQIVDSPSDSSDSCDAVSGEPCGLNRGTVTGTDDTDQPLGDGLELDPADLSSGQPPLRFQRMHLHAEGGLGKVYGAHDRELNRVVALKEIKGRYADDPDSRERFTKEAEITGRLEHPGIVPVYGLGKYADGRPYYAMRFVRGTSLRQAIRQHHDHQSADPSQPAMRMRALLGRFIAVCDAVYYAHRRGIVHRDLKPDNVMLGDYGETLVVDWGLAKNLGRRETDTSYSVVPVEETLQPISGRALTETMAGKAIGSPAFMSPEQARGEHDSVEFETDIYGLGATLYMILTGKAPVEGSTTEEVLGNVRQGKIIPPRSVDHSVPKPLQAICLKALALKPEDRYATVRDLRQDVERFLADELVSVYREPLIERAVRAARRRRWLVPAMLVGLLGLFAVGAVMSWARHTRQATLTATAEAKERAVQAAFSQIAMAYRVIDPFATNSANVAALEAECERIRDSDIPPIAKAMVYDALVFQFKKFKRPAVATHWAREALIISQQVLGPQHLKTRERQRELAQALYIDGQYDEAADVLASIIQAEDVQRDELYFGCVHDLSSAYIRLGRFGEAIPLIRQVVEYRTKTLGATDRRTITTLHQLGLALSNINQFDEANELLNQVAEAVSQSDDFSTANRLAMMQSPVVNRYRQGHYEEALSGFEQLYPQFIDALGPDHPQTLTVLLSIASSQRALGQYEKAIANLKDVIAKSKQVLGESHEQVWHAQLALGATLLASGDYEAAIDVVRSPLESYVSTFGFEHPNAHRGSQTLAYALLALDRFEEAEPIVARWREGKPSLLADLNVGALLAAGETALGRDNLGNARDCLAAAQRIEQPPDAVERAGLDSLQGAIALRQGDWQQAERALREAEARLQAAEQPLAPHQRVWAGWLEERLEILEESKAGAK